MESIYQLKIELEGSNPKVWRRIQVPDDVIFLELHDIIQIAMGWGDEHLYQFQIGNIRVYDFEDVIDDESNPLERDSIDTLLNEIVKMTKTRFTHL